VRPRIRTKSITTGKIFHRTAAPTMHTRYMFERTSQDALPLVLLIDDDLVSREVTATVLTMNGYTVHTAEDGLAALVLLTAAEGRPQALSPEPLRPDVILMDSQMPGLSGTQLIAELRARSSARICVVSGSNPPPELTAAADGFLLKPFSADAFRMFLGGGKPEHRASPFNTDGLGPNEPAVSPEIIAQFRKLMSETAVREVYQAVVTDLDRRIEALAAAIARGDDAEVRRIGHAIKGGCGMAGALQAARLGALLESGSYQSGDNQLDNSAALLSDLRAAARRLQNMLDAEMPV
jgi:CheY-like chemotaxis protein